MLLNQRKETVGVIKLLSFLYKTFSYYKVQICALKWHYNKTVRSVSPTNKAVVFSHSHSVCRLSVKGLLVT